MMTRRTPISCPTLRPASSRDATPRSSSALDNADPAGAHGAGLTTLVVAEEAMRGTPAQGTKFSQGRAHRRKYSLCETLKPQLGRFLDAP